MRSPLFPLEDLHKALTAADKRIEQLEQENAKMKRALEKLAECDLNPRNCADLSVASARVRYIAREALV